MEVVAAFCTPSTYSAGQHVVPSQKPETFRGEGFGLEVHQEGTPVVATRAEEDDADDTDGAKPAVEATKESKENVRIEAELPNKGAQDIMN